MKRLLLAAVVAALLTAAPVAAAPTATPRVWVVESGLRYGDPFTAATSVTRLTDSHYFHAVCDPDVTAEPWGQYFSASPTGPTPQRFQLIDPVAGFWTSGGASCVLTLEKVRWTGSRYAVDVLASSPFTVLP